MDFVFDYLSNVSPIAIPENRHDSSYFDGRGTKGYKVVRMYIEDVVQSYLYYLHNDEEVEPYINMHQNEIDLNNMNKNNNWRVMDIIGYLLIGLQNNSNSSLKFKIVIVQLTQTRIPMQLLNAEI